MAVNDVVIIIAILASLANGFLIASLLSNKKTRNPFGFLIVNIAVVDFLVGAFLKTSFYIEDLFVGDQILGVHCYLMTSFITSSPTIVIVTLIILSFYAVLSKIHDKPLRKFLSLDNTITFVFLLWMLTGGLTISFHAVFRNDKSHCIIEDNLLTAAVFYNFFLILILVTLHILIVSVQAFKRAKRVLPKREPEAVYNNLSVEVSEADTDDDENKHNVRLIFVLTIVFLIFWFPFYALRTYYELDSKSVSLAMAVYQIYAYILGYFKSVASPIATFMFYPESRYLIDLLSKKIINKFK